MKLEGHFAYKTIIQAREEKTHRKRRGKKDRRECRRKILASYITRLEKGRKNSESYLVLLLF